MFDNVIHCITINQQIMSTIAFRADDELRMKLEHIAKNKGVNLSALIKLYLTTALKKDLNEITENGMTVAEELELLAMDAEGDTGKTYSVDEYIKYLKKDD
jgi:predicted transcriptional regulator